MEYTVKRAYVKSSGIRSWLSTTMEYPLIHIMSI